MRSFKDYLHRRMINEMGYIILQQPITMQMGHTDQPIQVKMFDMQYEKYPEGSGLSNLSQYSPIVAKIPGSSRSYLVWNGMDAHIAKLAPDELESLLAQEERIGAKSVKYTLLPDNWFQYAQPVE